MIRIIGLANGVKQLVANFVLAIVAPSNGQVLRYDDGVWTNYTLPNMSPSGTIKRILIEKTGTNLKAEILFDDESILHDDDEAYI